jgi:glycosyltransferase involved in cell wall biosynthesis
MFSIIIPTFNNLEYLKLCLESINKNSQFKHEIIAHVNIGSDGTLDYLKSNNIKHTFTKYNSGICEGMNMAARKSKYDYILYAHDDFYFCPKWDVELKKEVDKLDYDFQGSTWAPHLIHKELWDKVGGFSEEFFPGTGSDPDLNMKLWQEGVRIFKGINNFKVYHFGSIVTRKYRNHPTIKTESGSRGAKIFLMKWGITISFFKKYFLRSDTKYDGKLNDPKKSLNFYWQLVLCKINYLYIRYIHNNNNKHKLIKNK